MVGLFGMPSTAPATDKLYMAETDHALRVARFAVAAMAAGRATLIDVDVSQLWFFFSSIGD